MDKEVKFDTPLTVDNNKKPRLTVDQVRLKIMDFDSENAPLYMQYLTDENLQTCITETIEDFNETPPIFRYGYTLEDFPAKDLLLIGSAKKAMELTAMKELRREMSYDDGGIQSNLFYKNPQFRQVISELNADYENKKTRIKRQINLEKCYGGIRYEDW